MKVNQYYQHNTFTPRRKVKKSNKAKLFGGLFALFLLAGLVVVLLNRSSNNTANQQPNQTVEQTSSNKQKPVEEQKPKLNYEGLQAVVEAWAAKNNGTYSVVATDLSSGQEMVNYQGSKSYFTASIYKLFVVYLAYQDVQTGKTKMTDIVSAGRNRQVCLDEAIRSSDSACGEALLAEIGSATLNAKLKEYGLTNTNFPGFTTTVDDTNLILQKIYKGENLSKENQATYLDSMKAQPEKYRQGLPKGITGAEVANKVGWSETPHYHDSAIVYLNDGRAYSLVIFSQDAEVNQITDLAKTIHQKLIS